MITLEEFFNVQINGLSIRQINETKGALAKVVALLGEVEISEISDDSRGPYFANFRYNGVTYYFADYNSRDLSGFEVTGANVTVKIQNKTIKVGDHVFQKLGNDIKLNNQKNGDKTVLFDFGGSEFIAIEFDQNTKIIAKIFYIVLT